MEFSDLKGKTLEDCWTQHGDDRIYFKISDKECYMLWHRNDCCESVVIEEIHGDLKDLVGSPILLAEEVSSSSSQGSKSIIEAFKAQSEYEESWTWTFYKIATIKGSVTIRWYGSSNGYYSESVDFDKVEM